MHTLEPAFWRKKSLAQMNQYEWEALCDGCGRCCLIKLEDQDTGEVAYTNVACHLLDTDNCRCCDYKHRQQLVSTCLVLQNSPDSVFALLPTTCAYRCLYENRPLPGWHPLLTQDKNSVNQAGISVCGKVVSEEYIHEDQLPEHLVDWIKTD